MTIMLDPVPEHRIRVHQLDPTLADVRIEFDDLPRDVEVRGRLMGPRCPGLSTIEIAHYLRPVDKAQGAYQVLIPEPSFWTEERPNIYQGLVELWRDGAIAARKTVSLGLRMGTGPKLHTVTA